MTTISARTPAGLEVARVGGGGGGVTLVLLHEGLGSVSTWRDWPARLHDATGLPVVAYSRRGYGKSPPVPLPRPLDYMQREGEAFAETLTDLGVDDAILVGHSDGASIALVAAATLAADGLTTTGATPVVRGLALLAPHVFVEDLTIASIERARREYDDASTGLRARLARHHEHVDVAFRGWNDAWLDPAFRTSFDLRAHLPRVRLPVVVVQGHDDPYGTVAQVRAIEHGVAGPCTTVLLDGCGHAPQRDKPDETTAAVAAVAAVARLVVAAKDALP